MIKRKNRHGVLMVLVTALWFSLLFLPFRGPKGAAILFLLVAAGLPLLKVFSGLARKLRPCFKDFSRILPRGRRYLYFLLIAVIPLPFVSEPYVTDVAIICGIYIILALGLNVVVGFAGLLNLGFVAFYAIGAYSYALLNTRLGLAFWSALPISVLVTTAAGFLLAIPSIRLKGDYFALVTLGFGEIARLVLNNWDSLTKGPNGISGIAPPSFFDVSLGRLSYYYYVVLVFVLIAIAVMHRVQDSKTGRAWIAIREDEIASSAMGINTLAYKLYSSAFGAFWAGIAGSLFAAKMGFVSPESFTFMESVFILCMVIIGGLGSITGVIVGAVLLVFLPEVLREVEMYRMLALGAGLVFLMVFRPQGLFGGKSVSLEG
jgi:branched-chain amino acid transport system permease protein